MSLVINQQNKKINIHINELFFNVDVARGFKQHLLQYLASDIDKITLDLAKVKILDSIAVGILVHAQTVCYQEDINFSIINVDPDIMELIKQVKLDKILKIHPYKENNENLNN